MTDGLHRIDGADGLTALPAGPVAPLGVREWALTRPDAHLIRVADGALVGRASVWWEGPPPVPGDPDAVAGQIGHAAWASAEVGETLVRAGLDELVRNGSTVALGPIDGSTWFSYRVVTDPAPDSGLPEPPFLLEPWPSDAVAIAFEAAGFVPAAYYLSSRVDRLPDESVRLVGDLRQLESGGVRLRSFDVADAEGELRLLYPLLLAAFADNPFYTPLDVERFVASYRAVLPLVDPALVLIAEREGEPVGVVLGLPDAAQAARGEPVDTVVVKTLAVAPKARGGGLGGVLVRAVHEAARARGLTRAVHALMHEDNASVRISRHLGRPIRRYALLSRAL